MKILQLTIVSLLLCFLEIKADYQIGEIPDEYRSIEKHIFDRLVTPEDGEMERNIKSLFSQYILLAAMDSVNSTTTANTNDLMATNTNDPRQESPTPPQSQPQVITITASPMNLFQPTEYPLRYSSNDKIKTKKPSKPPKTKKPKPPKAPHPDFHPEQQQQHQQIQQQQYYPQQNVLQQLIQTQPPLQMMVHQQQPPSGQGEVQPQTQGEATVPQTEMVPSPQLPPVQQQPAPLPPQTQPPPPPVVVQQQPPPTAVPILMPQGTYPPQQQPGQQLPPSQPQVPQYPQQPIVGGGGAQQQQPGGIAGIAPAPLPTFRPRPSTEHIFNQVDNILLNVGKGNITGIVDHSLQINSPQPVQNLVTGILNTIFCTPINRLLGRCRG